MTAIRYQKFGPLVIYNCEKCGLDKTESKSKIHISKAIDEEIANRLSLELLEVDKVIKARRMATVYTAIAAFENSLREFISRLFIESHGDNWWEEKVSEKVKKKAEGRINDEKTIKWHAQRGSEPINYTDFNDLTSLIIQHWDIFEPHFHSQDWIKGILSMLERSRNVIMHSGELEKSDIERVGTIIRDWVRQVGI